jgi:hypothetical protein
LRAAAARDFELQLALEALEEARRQGPEAVAALSGFLRGRALDLVMPDIVAAWDELAARVPPGQDSYRMTESEEEADRRSQEALEAISRSRALAKHRDPAGDRDGVAVRKAGGSSPDGPAVDRTVGAGCSYATIGAALSAAQPGDRLLLEGGRAFTENLSIQTSVTLQGGYAGCASGSSASTTIDGSSADRVVYIHENLTVTLANLVITNGFTAGNGAGVFVSWNTQLTGTDLDISNNTAAGSGGGVRLWGGSATFSDSNIHDNVAQQGAGVFAELHNGYAPVLNLLSYADVYGNEALTGSGFGGGVYMSEGTILASDCSDVYDNDAIEGGGVHLVGSTLTIAGSCSEIMINRATGDGGGVRAQGSVVNFDSEAELYNNSAGLDGSGNGGGAYLDDSDLWSDMGEISYNWAAGHGGGVYATNGSRLDMDLGGYVCTTTRCSMLRFNDAGSYGGGVYAANNSWVDLRQVFVERNTANFGGGIYAYDSPVYLDNVVVARNDAFGGVGDGIRLFTGSVLAGSDTTVVRNDAGGATTGSAVAMSSATLDLSNSIVWGHASSIPAGHAVECSDIQGGYAGVGNLDVDPQFVDPTGGDYHLALASPVIDRCSSGKSYDFENDPRPSVVARPATPYDMGADELLCLFGDGFESSDTSAWSQTAP